MNWLKSIGKVAGVTALIAAMYGCGGMDRRERDDLPDADVDAVADAYDGGFDADVDEGDSGDGGDGDDPDADEETDADEDIDTPEVPLLDHCYTSCSSTEVVPFERAGDTLGLNELLGDVVETMDSSDATALGSYTLTNSLGTTSVNQYLRFNWGAPGTTADRTFARVLHTKDDDDRVGEFLVFRDGEEAFRYETEFTEGLRSRISADGILEDLEGITLNMLGEEFIITSASIDGSDNLDLHMFGSATGTNVQEGATRTVECNGNTYVIQNMIVSEIDGEFRTRLNINGEVVDMEAGSYHMLSDGTTVFVRDIVEVTAEDGGVDQFVEIYLSDNHVHFNDTDTAATSTDGSVDINYETVEDSEVNIVKARDGDEVRLDKIVFTLYTDGARGDEPHLAPGEGLRSTLDEAIGMLSRYWDMTFSGITDPAISTIHITNSGGDEYRLTFINTQGIEYSNVRLAFVNSEGVFYGDDSDTLVFEQGSDPTDPDNFTLRAGDYLVLTHNGDTATGVTRILRYDTFFVDGRASFTDVGTGAAITAIVRPEVLPFCETGTDRSSGSVNVGGYSYDFQACWLATAGTPGLLFDVDDDGVLGGEATVVNEYGAIVDLGTQATDAYRAPVAGDSIDVAVTIEGDRFDEPHADETMHIAIYGDTSSRTADAEVVRDSDIGLLMVRHEAPDDTTYTGRTSFGIFADQYDIESSTVILSVPEVQVTATANVEFCYDEPI